MDKKAFGHDLMHKESYVIVIIIKFSFSWQALESHSSDSFLDEQHLQKNQSQFI